MVNMHLSRNRTVATPGYGFAGAGVKTPLEPQTTGRNQRPYPSQAA
jgi:hypothetical protein